MGIINIEIYTKQVTQALAWSVWRLPLNSKTIYQPLSKPK